MPGEAFPRSATCIESSCRRLPLPVRRLTIIPAQVHGNDGSFTATRGRATVSDSEDDRAEPAVENVSGNTGIRACVSEKKLDPRQPRALIPSIHPPYTVSLLYER